MGKINLKYLGMSFNAPNHSYVDKGFTTRNLSDVVNEEFDGYRTKSDNYGGTTVGGITATAGDKTTGGYKTVTAMKNIKGMPHYNKQAIAIHEQAHVADHAGRRDALENRFNLRLKYKSPEDVANLVMLSRLEEKGYNLERIVVTKENPSGLIVTDSTKRGGLNTQLRYHKRILKEYKRQKRKKIINVKKKQAVVRKLNYKPFKPGYSMAA